MSDTTPQLDTQFDTQLLTQFDTACARIIGRQYERVGIGVLGEKTLHAVLKHTLAPNPDCHEVKLGRHHVDILDESGVTEIQTVAVGRLSKKLPVLLEGHVVTVVLPIAHRKWVCWLDGETGEVTAKRKSPLTGNITRSLPDLYRIKPLLLHHNLRIKVILLDLVEYRNLNGWSRDRKRGSSRYERIPEKLVSVTDITTPSGYSALLPKGLPTGFTVKDFKKAAGLSPKAASLAVNVLRHVGVIEQIAKQGNALVYKVADAE